MQDEAFLSESHGEDGLLVGNRFGSDSAPVEPQDLPGKAQSDSRSIAFGGEEGNENFINHVVQDSLAIINHLDSGPTSFIVEAPDLNPALFGRAQSLQRVLYQIDKYLLNHLLINL